MPFFKCLESTEDMGVWGATQPPPVARNPLSIQTHMVALFDQDAQAVGIEVQGIHFESRARDNEPPFPPIRLIGKCLIAPFKE